jgi:hypothetical protein
VDLYRNKVRGSVESSGHSLEGRLGHFETRVGKRKFLQRSAGPRGGVEKMED